MDTEINTKANSIEKQIIDIIDSHRDEIINFARDIYSHAELGYKEFETSRKFVEFSRKLGLTVKEGLAITGAKAYLNQDKKDEISLALIGELDALRIPNHAYVNPETQAAHCCGHHAQRRSRSPPLRLRRSLTGRWYSLQFRRRSTARLSLRIN